jgi:hypothetical protein
VLELCMLVAAQRLEDAGSGVFNFQVSGVVLPQPACKTPIAVGTNGSDTAAY